MNSEQYIQEQGAQEQKTFARVLITGGMGFFGWNAAEHFRQQHITPILSSSSPKHYAERWGDDVAYLNVLDRRSIEECLNQYQPDVILHAAALSAPLACEKDHDIAHAVNVTGTQNVVEIAAKYAIPLVFTSTDLVFSGEKDVLHDGYYSEDDVPDARIVYGKTKITAERFIQTQPFGKWIILRPALMFGRRVEWANGFPQFAVDLLKSGKPATLFTDQFRTPAYIPDIVRAIILLLRAEKFGEIYHCGGWERIDRASFVRRYCAVAGVDTSNIVDCTMNDMPNYTTKVCDVSLSNAKLLRSASDVFWRATPFEQAFREMNLGEISRII